MSSSNLIVVTDDTVLEYDIGFPVSEIDLAVFEDGRKLISGTDYTFNQSKNSITLVSVAKGAMLQLRKIRSK